MDRKLQLKFNLFFYLFFSFQAFANLAELESKGFTCRPQNYNNPTSHCVGCEGEEAGAISCTGMLSSYPDLVTIVFNRKALKERPENLATFFHGLTNAGTSVNQDVLNRFNFQKKVEEMKRPFAMVIPHYPSIRSGPKKNTHLHYNHLYSDQSWTNFQNEFTQLVNPKENAKFHLMGHSGAYRVLARRALDRNTHFESVTLLDAAYGSSQELSHWKNRDVKKFNSYYIADSPTAVQNRIIRQNMGPEAVLRMGKQSRPGDERITFIELTHRDVNHWTLVDHAFSQFNF